MVCLLKNYGICDRGCSFTIRKGNKCLTLIIIRIVVVQVELPK